MNDPEELDQIEEGLHGPAMQCRHCNLIRRLVAEARENA